MFFTHLPQPRDFTFTAEPSVAVERGWALITHRDSNHHVYLNPKEVAAIQILELDS